MLWLREMLLLYGQEPTRTLSSQLPRRGRAALGLVLAAATISLQCTFPEYDRLQSPGSAGSGPNQGASGATTAGSGVGGSLALAGEAGAAALCPDLPALASYPDHCFDGDTSGDELRPDCGGSCQGCSTGSCQAAAECLSGECTAGGLCDTPLTLTYKADELNPQVNSLAWRVRVTNTSANEQSFATKDLKVRYYFERDEVVEPMLIRSPQAIATIAGGGFELASTVWSVERVVAPEDADYTAYVEIALGPGRTLFPGDSVELYQQLTTGASSSLFDQRVNYSSANQAAGDYAPWPKVTVFLGEKLIWGQEPPAAISAACWFRGVNLHGPAVTIAGNLWQAASETMLTTTGSSVAQEGTFNPAATGELASLLATAVRLEAGETLKLPVPNQTYLVYLYAVSLQAMPDLGTILVEGAVPEPASRFKAQEVEGGRAWGRLGPYRAEVSDGELTVGVSEGAVSFAGIELHQLN